MNRLYFGEYCKHKDSKGPCLNETDKKCSICNSPRCSRHLKKGRKRELDICVECALRGN